MSFILKGIFFIKFKYVLLDFDFCVSLIFNRFLSIKLMRFCVLYFKDYFYKIGSNY